MNNLDARVYGAKTSVLEGIEAYENGGKYIGSTGRRGCITLCTRWSTIVR